MGPPFETSGNQGMGMSNENFDAARERRRLRASVEAMKRKRNLAVGGFVAALGCLWGANHYSEFPETVRWAMYIAAPLIFIPLALPFLRSSCPQCKGRYHSATSLFSHPDRLPPCKSCGFNVDKHVSMY